MTRSFELLNDLLSFFEQQEDGSWTIEKQTVVDEDLSYALTEAYTFIVNYEQGVVDEDGLCYEDS